VAPDFSLVEAYTSKAAVFKFRGLELRFALSHGLFSSADVDRGTALLLKVLSRLWDEDRAAGKPQPRHILDAGCGAGIIAVCAAAALRVPDGGAAVQGAEDGSPAFHIRAQDRDELARLFTGYNARANGIDPEYLSAHTEVLLSGPPGIRWDLILSNIPAKAGRPVLEDFVRRSVLLLNPGGKIIMVAVNTLADFFRSQISGAGGRILREESGPAHTVFAYRAEADREREAAPALVSGGFSQNYPCYLRESGGYELEGLPLRLDTFHGAPGFDRPGGAAEAAAKMTVRLELNKLPASAPSALIHEPGQGWFPAWFLTFPGREGGGGFSGCPLSKVVLSGRNILALEAARHNLDLVRRSIRPAGGTAAPFPELSLSPAVELSPLGLAGLLEDGSPGGAGPFGFIAAFPETVPRTDRWDALWEGLAAFLAPGGIALLSLPSSEADRFDRRKPPGFRRLGHLRRNGFRALAYQLSPPN
jgi:predicted RNA methylase